MSARWFLIWGINLLSIPLVSLPGWGTDLGSQEVYATPTLRYRTALATWGANQGKVLPEGLYQQGSQIGASYCQARQAGIPAQQWMQQHLNTLASTPDLSVAQMQSIAVFTGAAVHAYAPYFCPEVADLFGDPYLLETLHINPVP
ncbi:MAG: hypothetical protein NW237_11090 [Cyanobacteriota bacterium]|nr:hypothetical protein [Cyanobacteriota bacterium]